MKIPSRLRKGLRCRMTTAGMTWWKIEVRFTDGTSAPSNSTHLLSQLWFTLLDGSDEHITDTSSWQTIQATTNAMDGDNVQVLTTLKWEKNIFNSKWWSLHNFNILTSVIGAVHDGSDWASERDAEFTSGWSTTTWIDKKNSVICDSQQKFLFSSSSRNLFEPKIQNLFNFVFFTNIAGNFAKTRWSTDGPS